MLLFIIAASFLTVPGPVDAAPRPGQTTPNFKVTSTAGQTISQENYRGHVLVIDFFATWCLPCRQSIPHLVEMNRKYGKQGLEILGLSMDEDGERAVKAFADEFRVNYPLALARDSVTVEFGVRSIPVMYLIDKKGKIEKIYRGYSSEIARSMEQSIKRLLAEK
ncbi:MAG: TlpA family protein disulfide reductase [Geobacteraceae bacterium]|nr:TlpA family protein disulfide reductase [Geobacteraceae bacterium]NTW79363.1 TlpA family protein disulfide reductase [Geobacteraceae bacterium]